MKKRLLLTTGLLLIFAVFCFAQKPYKVAFWNVENFFDTIDDPQTFDEEFSPAGPKRWNSAKYYKKLENIERVLYDIAAIDKSYPVVVGLSEVENRSVLEDIVASPKLAPANYRISHFDSPEARGMDAAFIYRPDVFKLEGAASVRADVPQLPDFKTRDISTMWGTIEGEPFYFMVIHWPSRIGGAAASEFKRVAIGEQMRRMKDSVLRIDPATKVVAMGDFNDDPTDRSLLEALGARPHHHKLAVGDFFSPYYQMLRAGEGTLAYRDAWNIFDNIVVTENLATGSTGALKLQRAAGSKYWGNIFKKSYMLQREGQFKGYPLRTFVGNNFMGGFSDHFPVYIYIGK